MKHKLYQYFIIILPTFFGSCGVVELYLRFKVGETHLNLAVCIALMLAGFAAGIAYALKLNKAATTWHKVNSMLNILVPLFIGSCALVEFIYRLATTGTDSTGGYTFALAVAGFGVGILYIWRALKKAEAEE